MMTLKKFISGFESVLKVSRERKSVSVLSFLASPFYRIPPSKKCADTESCSINIHMLGSKSPVPKRPARSCMRSCAANMVCREIQSKGHQDGTSHRAEGGTLLRNAVTKFSWASTKVSTILV